MRHPSVALHQATFQSWRTLPVSLFSRVVVDLESCAGTESPYVMLSRATSLEGVIILRPFAKSKI
ncbi:hypothetical protein C8Q76DRAFT_717157 [Earliella scabrosa]|nr:hypothetical protein C8Q76DRAFT_717157 [Earliella scabrosa]